MRTTHESAVSSNHVSLAPFYARARRRRIWRRLRWPLFIGSLILALVALALVLNWLPV